MKRIAKFSITSLLLIISSYGCVQHDITDNNMAANNQKGNKIVFVDNSFMHEVKRDTIIAYDLGKYLDYIAPTNYITGLASSKLNPLQGEYVYAFTDIMNKNNPLTKAFLSQNELPVIKINDIPIKETVNTKSSLYTIDWKSSFGTNNRFDIPKKIRTKSGSEQNGNETVEMYIPELLEITSPVVESEEDLYPLCDYKSFVVRWNADENNKNGVLVVVEWTGVMLYGEDYPDAYIRCVDLVDDTGEALLSKEMFEGIPDTALCHLTLLRGNVENIMVDDYSYKLIGQSNQQFAFVLIREIKYIE